MLDKIIKETHEGLNLNKINDDLYLTNNQIKVLEKYDINYHTSIEQLLYNLEEILNEEDYPDLEEVSDKIAEFNYYHNTKK